MIMFSSCVRLIIHSFEGWNLILCLMFVFLYALNINDLPLPRSVDFPIRDQLASTCHKGQLEASFSYGYISCLYNRVNISYSCMI